MRKRPRILSLILSVFMVLSVATQAFAAPVELPVDSDLSVTESAEIPAAVEPTAPESTADPETAIPEPGDSPDEGAEPADGVLTAEEEAETTDTPAPVTETVTYINPLFADVITEADLVAPDAAAPVALADDVCTSVAEVGQVLREQLKNRQETVTASYASTEEYSSALPKSMMDAAMEHTGVSTEGDYLKWQYAGWRSSTSYSSSGGVYTYFFTFTVTYYTTAEQEAVMNSTVPAVLAGLDLGGNDYTKVLAIYDYLCENVTYDYANLYDDDYKLKYTAYAALVNKTAVCQGYAVLFYRMALEAGVDARVITGIGNGGAHAWNIAQVGNFYYDLDATWDAGRSAYSYFFQTDADFGDHTRGDDYTSSAFTSQYPMGPESCDWSNYQSTGTEATCLEVGREEYTCSVCHNVVTGTETAALGHDFGEWIVVTEPTETTDGEEVRTCNRCSIQESNVLPATGSSGDSTGGSYGENLTWTLKGDTLTISGTGEMGPGDGSFPWSSLSYTNLVLGEGITSIQSDAFSYNYSLESGVGRHICGT